MNWRNCHQCHCPLRRMRQTFLHSLMKNHWLNCHCYRYWNWLHSQTFFSWSFFLHQFLQCFVVIIICFLFLLKLSLVLLFLKAYVGIFFFLCIHKSSVQIPSISDILHVAYLLHYRAKIRIQALKYSLDIFCPESHKQFEV